MATDFIPRPDGLALTMMQGFAQNIADNPGLFFLSGPDSQTISNAVDEFAVSYAASENELNRNSGTILIKSQKRVLAEAVVRQFAALIRANAGISDAAKNSIGVRPVKTTREVRPCPMSAPTITGQAATNGAQTYAFADSLDPSKKAKPAGADGIEIFLAIADEPVSDPSEAKYIRKFTINPVVMFFEAGDRGKVATIFGRWVGQRGDVGTFSSPVSMAIAA